jgi:hypothetical protein
MGPTPLHRRVRRLEVRVLPLDDCEIPGWFEARFFVSGKDIGGKRWMGWDPDKILGVASPLLPTDPPRRVAVYLCACTNAGCASLAPLIHEAGDYVQWLDVKSLTGVFDEEPTSEHPLTADQNRSADYAGITFDASQYRSEIARASMDRSWESTSRATARLLQEHLARERKHFSDHGRLRAWPDPSEPGTIQVDVEDNAGNHNHVKLHAESGNPPEDALRLAEFLFRTPPDEWRLQEDGRR